MGMETRGCGSYYYKKCRIGSKVVSKYQGKESQAKYLYDMDRLDRSEKIDGFEREKEMIAEIKDLNFELRSLNNSIKDILKSIYIVSGYYFHKGELRKMGKQDDITEKEMEEIQSDFISLLTKKNPSKKDMDNLKNVFKEVPSIAKHYDLANKIIFNIKMS